MSKTILKRIKQVKSTLNLTQQALADAGNISKGTVRNIFSGSSTPNVTALQNWAQNLDINLNWLICGTGEMFSKQETLAHELNETKITTTDFGPLAIAVSAREKSTLAIDPDASETEILDDVISALTRRRRKLAPQTYGYAAKEIPLAHEEQSDYPHGHACGIDTDPPTPKKQTYPPSSKTK
ncbi:helix-turn-helix domain-containing protein [Pseudodesulfovibrio sp. JC047]|uniref:helix-turn-helix domain-containing protein n=1 Tax=Pseudodesulfovibrio sp. JC047 TaxID=2683199 RepID=UPI0013D005BF|nr:helix-turn-helix transcriptional regulator [Pseudodesulfovibrio sp. JC047]NDV20982.1 helix-turn-helix domain-containing protein [Pseudodesulfovibrio sp. JC047]